MTSANAMTDEEILFRIDEIRRRRRHRKTAFPPWFLELQAGWTVDPPDDEEYEWEID